MRKTHPVRETLELSSGWGSKDDSGGPAHFGERGGGCDLEERGLSP